MKNEKRFPILNKLLTKDKGITISWSAAEIAFFGYEKKYGKGQSLEKIAERGGFGIEEMDEFYPEWRNHFENRRKND